MLIARLRAAAICAVAALTLAGCTAAPAPQPPVAAAAGNVVGTPDAATTVVTIGDSIMAGYGLDPDSAWPVLLAGKTGVPVVNLGCSGGGFIAVGGCGTDFEGLIDQARQQNPAIIIIQSSDNDDDQSAPAIRDATLRTVSALHAAAPDALIVGLSTLWDQPDEQPSTIGAATAALRAALSSVGGTFVDIGQPLAGNPQLLQADDEHPTVAGQQVLVRAIGDRLADAGIEL